MSPVITLFLLQEILPPWASMGMGGAMVGVLLWASVQERNERRDREKADREDRAQDRKTLVELVRKTAEASAQNAKAIADLRESLDLIAGRQCPFGNIKQP